MLSFYNYIKLKQLTKMSTKFLLFFLVIKSVEQNFFFTTGQRSSIKLVYKGFQFVKYIKNSKGTKWICATRSSTKCRARLRTTSNANLEILCSDHNHEVLRTRMQNRNRRSKLLVSKNNC